MSGEDFIRPIARVTDPLGAHASSLGWLGMALGAVVAIAAIVCFPVIIGVGVVGAGLMGAAMIGLGAVSLVTGAAAIGAKLGKLVKNEDGTPCSEIASGSKKTKAEGLWVARMNDPNTHGSGKLLTGSSKVYEGGFPVSRVKEQSTCGASKVLKGATRTIVGGESVTSGAKMESTAGEELLDSVIAKLDFVSKWTGLAQLPLLAVTAVRVGGTHALTTMANEATKRATFRATMQQATAAGLKTTAGRELATQAVINATARGSRVVLGASVELVKTGVGVGVVMGGSYVAAPILSKTAQFFGASEEAANVISEGLLLAAPNIAAVRGSRSLARRNAIPPVEPPPMHVVDAAVVPPPHPVEPPSPARNKAPTADEVHASIVRLENEHGLRFGQDFVFLEGSGKNGKGGSGVREKMDAISGWKEGDPGIQLPQANKEGFMFEGHHTAVALELLGEMHGLSDVIKANAIHHRPDLKNPGSVNGVRIMDADGVVVRGPGIKPKEQRLLPAPREQRLLPPPRPTSESIHGASGRTDGGDATVGALGSGKGALPCTTCGSAGKTEGPWKLLPPPADAVLGPTPIASALEATPHLPLPPGVKPLPKMPKFELQELDPYYVGEHLPNNGQWGDTHVEYHTTLAERAPTALHVGEVNVNGKMETRLLDADGNVFDTAAATTWSGGGSAIYVMGADGQIYASKVQKVGEFHHSSLLGGEPVAAAGEIRVKDGVIEMISNKSGHYQPPASFTEQALNSLLLQGLDVNGVKMYDEGTRTERFFP